MSDVTASYYTFQCPCGQKLKLTLDLSWEFDRATVKLSAAAVDQRHSHGLSQDHDGGSA